MEKYGNQEISYAVTMIPNHVQDIVSIIGSQGSDAIELQLCKLGNSVYNKDNTLISYHLSSPLDLEGNMTYKRHKGDLQGAQRAIDLIINQLKQLVTLDFMHILRRTTDSNKTQVSIYFGGLAKLTIPGLGDNHDFTTKEGFTYIFEGVKPGSKEDNLGI